MHGMIKRLSNSPSGVAIPSVVKNLCTSLPVSMLRTEDILITVSPDDKPIGSVSKERAHRRKELYVEAQTKERPLLHRAFSVFHFDDNSSLLLTQRSDKKVTFPMQWTNACCSHPLWNIPEENGGPIGGDAETILAVKRAAQRRLQEELNMSINVEDLTFISRILYYANANKDYAEHEIDYILISKLSVPFKAHPNEVNATKWVSKDELRAMLNDQSVVFTPWSRYIMKSFLFDLWNGLDTLESFQNFKTIYNAGDLS
uniref:isopentenyl-diphosphate Delta-isomerase n=1 Tax=Cardiosporidium cionae TaxID=476202 RepID=A0A3Q8UBF8_9APIC|nr:isopentenyl diphosphate isomerase [Cardiosporidium cionae]